MDKSCGNCAGCDSCGGCAGCGSSLELTPGEIQVLQVLEQIPFLPVARRADSMDAVCLEEELKHMDNIALVLAVLEKKSLIDLDYRTQLKGFDYGAYARYPCRGSMALTRRGQTVLELLAVQGVQA